MHTKYWSTNLTGKEHLEDFGVDGKMVLEWYGLDAFVSG